MHYINLIPAILMIFTLLYSVHHNRKILQENGNTRKEDNDTFGEILKMQAEILQEMRQDRKEHREDMKTLIETLTKNTQTSGEAAQKRHEENSALLMEALKELRRGR